MKIVFILAVWQVVTFSLKAQDTTAVFTCQPYTWLVNGVTYTSSANATVGDQVLNLTVYENSVQTKRIFSCNDYLWSRTGQTYTASGTYTDLETTPAGCTIEHQLVLTISNTSSASWGASDCDSYQWHELDGPVGDMQPRSVSIDGSGTTLAVGDYAYGANNGGKAAVYRWSEGGWTQMGTGFSGADYTNLGRTVRLSRNGKYLAVASTSTGSPGSVSIYRWNGSDWEQRGSTIVGVTAYDELGSSIDFNNDGSIIALGAPKCNRVRVQLGEVRVYHWVGNDWAPMGNPLYEYTSSTSIDNHGTSVALSGDGLRVSVGVPLHDVESPFVKVNGGGRYLIYDWDGSKWTLTQKMEGYRQDMGIGRSVAISEDGETYAGGGDLDRSSAGIVHSNKGRGRLVGLTTGDRYGYAVSYNQAADVIAISSVGNKDVALSAGMVQVLTYHNNDWSQMGQNLYGEVEIEQFGYRMQLNADGNVLVVGSFGDNASTGAHVYYYGCATPAQNCSASVCEGPFAFEVNRSACGHYGFNAKSIYESGQYQAMFTSKNGCDSLVTLNLTIINNTDFAQYVNACGSYDFNGETLTASGVYTATLTSSLGCDSLVSLHLNLAGGEPYHYDIEACNSYLFDGGMLTSSGTYNATFTSTAGCDSLVTIDLSIVDSFDQTVNKVACDSFEFGGNTLTTSGTYHGAFTSVAGCDSLVTLNLEVVSQFDQTVDTTTCNDFIFDGLTLTEGGTYHATFLTSSGCDSLVTLNLAILAPQVVNKTEEACGTFDFGGTSLTTSGNYSKNFTATNGCDSLVNLSLAILDETECLVLGVPDAVETRANIFPNPTSDGFIYIDWLNGRPADYKLVDPTGELIGTGCITDNRLFVSDEAGVFFLYIIVEDRVVAVKVIVQ